MFEIVGVVLSGIGVLNDLLGTHNDLKSLSHDCLLTQKTAIKDTRDMSCCTSI